MAGKKKTRNGSLFKGIRKPTAPPTRKFGEKKPDEKAHPAGRAAKHKREQSDTNDADL